MKFSDNFSILKGRLVIIDGIVGDLWRGKRFSASNLFGSVADGDNVDLYLESGEDIAIIGGYVSATGQTTIDVYVGNDISDEGTSVEVYHRNQMSNTENTAEVWHTPSVNSLGTQEGEDFIAGGGRRNLRIGGTSKPKDGHLIGPNSDILVRCTNTTTSEQKIFIKYIWSEDSLVE